MHMTKEWARIESRKWHEKRQVAAHEAGHATVGYVKGMLYVRAWIYPNQTGNLFDQSTWLGQVSAGTPRGLRRDAAAFSIAGIVGEWIRQHPEATADDIEWAMEDLKLQPSRADWKGIPDDGDERFLGIVEALEILRQQKPLFDEITRLLIEGEYLSDGDIRDLASELLA